MKRIAQVLVCMYLVTVPARIHAQDGNDNPSFTDSLGMTISAPVSSISHYASTGLGTDMSMGYNFDGRHALVGDFMWNWLYANDSALQPLRVALQTPNIGGHANLYSITADYKYELRGRALGVYLIGGGGWYRRSTSITKQIPAGTPPIACQPVWFWWGYSCSSGFVTTSLTVANSTSNAFGGNAGIGFTIRVGDAPYRFYVESRYHYAPTKNISTQLVAFSFGFRY